MAIETALTSLAVARGIVASLVFDVPRLRAAMKAAASSETAGAGPDAGEAPQDEKKDDVVDADYEVVDDNK